MNQIVCIRRTVGWLVALSALGCSPSNPSCGPAAQWNASMRRCVGSCGTPEHPALEDCYADGSYVGSDASDATIDAGVGQTDTGVASDVLDSGAAQPDGDASADAGLMCTGASVLCAGSCVETASNSAHCGACGRACTTSVSNARATCVMSVCDFECAAGFELVGATCEAKVPRAIGPMTSATVTSQRPTLEWELPAGVTTASVEVCRDRAMTANCVTLTATATRVRPTTALTPGVWFWRIRSRVGGTVGTRTSPVWWFRVGHADAPVDTFHGVELDVNGDGWADVAAATGDGVGTPQVQVHHGGLGGIAMTPSRVLDTTAPYESFGWRLSAGGDINGDGFVDLLVSAPSAVVGGMRVGQVRVYFGGVTGVSAIPTNALMGEQVDAQFGREIAPAGDVNGDGYADVVVGTIFATSAGRTQAGRMWLYLGGPSGLQPMPARTWDGATTQAFFGNQVVGLGDVNGDRLGDIAASAPYANERSLELNGAAYVFLGSRSTLAMDAATVLPGPTSGASFSEGIAFVGDVTGDGYADFAVGGRGVSPTPSYAGTVQLFVGSAGGIAASAVSTVNGSEQNARWFDAIRSLGDVNGDGRADVGLGYTPTSGLPGGALLIYFGRTTGLPSMADSTMLGDAMAGTVWGSLPSLGGHWDDDGLADVLIISPCADASASLRETGRLSWYRGRRTGFESTPVQVLHGSTAAACLGGGRFGLQLAW